MRKRYRLPDDYLLWVGGLRAPRPAQARRRAGRGAARRCRSCSSARRSRWAHELPDVTLTGHVPDDDLAAIYTGARALVFPSDDEGFGLPTVEALACGTPVVACDVPALREVLGDRATFVEPGDLDGLLAAGRAARGRRPRRRRGRGTTRRAPRGRSTPTPSRSGARPAGPALSSLVCLQRQRRRHRAGSCLPSP